MFQLKSSLEVVIRSLTKNNLLLRDLTLNRPILMVLLTKTSTGSEVDFGLQGVVIQFFLSL